MVRHEGVEPKVAGSIPESGAVSKMIFLIFGNCGIIAESENIMTFVLKFRDFVVDFYDFR